MNFVTCEYVNCTAGRRTQLIGARRVIQRAVFEYELPQPDARLQGESLHRGQCLPGLAGMNLWALHAIRHHDYLLPIAHGTSCIYYYQTLAKKHITLATSFLQFGWLHHLFRVHEVSQFLALVLV